MALAVHYVETTRYTEDEYFAVDESSRERWEFVNGEIRQMAGGSDDHNTISSNLIRTIGNSLETTPCRIYGSDMKVHTGDGINTYPDASVVCGTRTYYRGRTSIVTNPVLIIEILSDSTENYDRTDKFEHYATIPTLRDYLLISQEEPRVWLAIRAEKGWGWQEASGTDGAIDLPALEISLPLSNIYARIEFAEA